MPLKFDPNVDECIRARVHAGYNIRQAALALNVTPTHLGYVEAGNRRPSPALVKRMADLYGVPIASLLIEKSEDAA